MKKRFLMLTAAMCFVFAIPAHAEIEEIYDPSLPTATQTAPLYDVTSKNFRNVYTGYRVATDYEGNPCLIVYGDYTNLGTESNYPAGSYAIVDAYQNGVQLDIGVLPYDDKDKAVEAFTTKIQPNITVNAARVFKLTDSSDVTLECSNVLDFNGTPQKATIKVN